MQYTSARFPPNEKTNHKMKNMKNKYNSQVLLDRQLLGQIISVMKTLTLVFPGKSCFHFLETFILDIVFQITEKKKEKTK